MKTKHAVFTVAVIFLVLSCATQPVSTSPNNKKNDNGMNDLLSAISMGQSPEKVESLLKSGFDINSRDQYGVNTLQWAIMCINPELKRTPRSPEEEINIVKLLLKKKVDINNVGGGRTALHDAIMVKRLDIVKLLIENKIDSNIKYHGDLRTLQFAREQGNEEIVKYLVSVGIK